MADSNAPHGTLVSGADGAGFEIHVTAPLIERFQEELIDVGRAARRGRAEAVRKKWEPWSAASNPEIRRSLTVVCILGAFGSAFGALLFFGDADWVGMSIWIGIGALFLVFALLFAMAPRIRNRFEALAIRWRAKTDARIEKQIGRSLEPLFRAAPYKVRHELDRTDHTWTLHSQRSGERTFPVSPQMIAFHSGVAYLVVKPGLLARPVLSAIVETAEQRRVLDEFLSSCGVRVTDVMAKVEGRMSKE
jgi:hypothetical protein